MKVDFTQDSKIHCNLTGYNVYLQMIVSIVHKGLKQLWLKNDPSKLPAEQVDK